MIERTQPGRHLLNRFPAINHHLRRKIALRPSRRQVRIGACQVNATKARNARKYRKHRPTGRPLPGRFRHSVTEVPVLLHKSPGDESGFTRSTGTIESGLSERNGLDSRLRAADSPEQSETRFGHSQHPK